MLNLPKLDIVVKRMVNSGRYTLYAVIPQDRIHYALDTGSKCYLLDSDGEVVSTSSQLNDFNPTAVVTFPEVPAPKNSIVVSF